MSQELTISDKKFGIASMVLGGVALLTFLFHFWAGPLTPQKSLERSIAEIAVNISKEVVRVARDEPAVLEAKTWSIDDVLAVSASLLAASALIVASIGFVRREDKRPLIAGLTLGACALTFQFISWVALLIGGLVLIWIVLSNLGVILGSTDISL